MENTDKMENTENSVLQIHSFDYTIGIVNHSMLKSYIKRSTNKSNYQVSNNIGQYQHQNQKWPWKNSFWLQNPITPYKYRNQTLCSWYNKHIYLPTAHQHAYHNCCRLTTTVKLTTIVVLRYKISADYFWLWCNIVSNRFY